MTAAGVPDGEIDVITHGNAMRHFRYDPFRGRPRREVTVGALRARAADVDVTPHPRAGAGAAKPKLTKSTDLIATAQQRR